VCRAQGCGVSRFLCLDFCAAEWEKPKLQANGRGNWRTDTSRHPADTAGFAAHWIGFSGRNYCMKAIHLIVLVIIVGALFLLVNGLFSAWALLELAWTTIISFVNRF